MDSVTYVQQKIASRHNAVSKDHLINSTPHASTPYIEALFNYSQHGFLSPHLPGHHGKSICELSDIFLPESVLKYDVAQVADLGNLYNRTGPIGQSQARCADSFGSDNAWYLVSGGTGANLVALATLLQDGDQILLPRNSHRSVIGGIIQSGARPIYINPRFHHELGLELPLTADQVEAALKKHRNVKAVMILSPTITGIVPDVKRIAEVVHQYDIPLFVDQAWGAHFAFHSKLPADAIDAGADIVSTSMHKRMPALTGAALLRSSGTRVCSSRIERFINHTQTTSPNSLILASMEAALIDTSQNGAEEYSRLINRLDEIRDELVNVDGIRLLHSRLDIYGNAFEVDPTNLTFAVDGCRTGHDLARALAACGVHTNLTDEGSVSLHFAMRSPTNVIKEVAAAIQKVAGSTQRSGTVFKRLNLPNPKYAMTPRLAFQSDDSVPVCLSKCVGRISADTISAYPPAVPIIGPGEFFSIDHIKVIQEYEGRGAQILGLDKDRRAWVI